MNTLAEKILFNEECLKKLKDIWRKYSEVVVSKANLLKYISDEVKEMFNELISIINVVRKENILFTSYLNYKSW